jgi:hypothetical protein
MGNEVAGEKIAREVESRAADAEGIQEQRQNYCCTVEIKKRTFTDAGRFLAGR